MKTRFWSAIANDLQHRGHQISWIVQNHVYAPKALDQSVVKLPYPRSADLRDVPIPEILNVERGRDYFEAGVLHYDHYKRHISAEIERLLPDAVIGEPTLFHELLAVQCCCEKNIPYLHPTMTRYPSGRFAIMKGDSQYSYSGSNDQVSSQILQSLVNSFSDEDTMPSYMQTPTARDILERALRLTRSRILTFIGRLAGEHYNTPSVRRKLLLNWALRKNLRAWARYQSGPDPAKPAILYPLQMQPEANIDVWGRPYSDQVAFIEALLAAMPEGGQVAVKANPKSKYEVNDSIISLAQKNKSVVLLPLHWNMADAQKACIGAITVSGTVGYEAIFGRGRCISLRHPIIEEMFPSCHAASPQEAVERLLNDPNSGYGDNDMSKEFLERLYADSFEGEINDFDYNPDCALPENVEKVSQGLIKALAEPYGA